MRFRAKNPVKPCPSPAVARVAPTAALSKELGISGLRDEFVESPLLQHPTHSSMEVVNADPPVEFQRLLQHPPTFRAPLAAVARRASPGTELKVRFEAVAVIFHQEPPLSPIRQHKEGVSGCESPVLSDDE
jgi:hypothetical protein